MPDPETISIAPQTTAETESPFDTSKEDAIMKDFDPFDPNTSPTHPGWDVLERSTATTGSEALDRLDQATAFEDSLSGPSLYESGTNPWADASDRDAKYKDVQGNVLSTTNNPDSFAYRAEAAKRDAEISVDVARSNSLRSRGHRAIKNLVNLGR